MQKNPPYSKWFRELRHILDQNPHNKKVANSVMFVTRQSKNLQRALTSAKVTANNERQRRVFEQGAGSKRCSGCHACPKIQQTKVFKSTNTKRQYQIRQQISCRSSFLIYLCYCTNSPLF